MNRKLFLSCHCCFFYAAHIAFSQTVTNPVITTPLSPEMRKEAIALSARNFRRSQCFANAWRIASVFQRNLPV